MVGFTLHERSYFHLEIIGAGDVMDCINRYAHQMGTKWVESKPKLGRNYWIGPRKRKPSMSILYQTLFAREGEGARGQLLVRC